MFSGLLNRLSPTKLRSAYAEMTVASIDEWGGLYAAVGIADNLLQCGCRRRAWCLSVSANIVRLQFSVRRQCDYSEGLRIDYETRYPSLSFSVTLTPFRGVWMCCARDCFALTRLLRPSLPPPSLPLSLSRCSCAVASVCSPLYPTAAATLRCQRKQIKAQNYSQRLPF